MEEEEGVKVISTGQVDGGSEACTPQEVAVLAADSIRQHNKDPVPDWIGVVVLKTHL